MSYLPLNVQWHGLTIGRPKGYSGSNKKGVSIMMVDFGLHGLCGGIIGHEMSSLSRPNSPHSSSSSAIYYPPVHSRPSIQMPTNW